MMQLSSWMLLDAVLWTAAANKGALSLSLMQIGKTTREKRFLHHRVLP
jgi:hypothetical protein